MKKIPANKIHRIINGTSEPAILIDEKINLNDLLNLSAGRSKDSKNNILYELNELKVLVCNNKDVVIGKNITLENGYCEVLEEDGV